MKRILVVDDEKSTVFGLRALMAEDDVEILVATTMMEAVEKLSDCAIDLLLSDIRLSTGLQSEGIDLLEFIKTKCPNTKVILMTGYGTPAIQKRAIESGADFYFEKPMELEDLAIAVGKLLFA